MRISACGHCRYPSRMPVRQYAYFALTSPHTSANEMASLLNITPDEVTVRDSRSTEPVVVPVTHRWKVYCREPDLGVDEQIAHILNKLRPHTDLIPKLAGRLTAEGGGAVLQIVRYFNGIERDQLPDRPGDSDSPNLFGWHLDRHVLEFISAVGAELDVDEYDLSGRGRLTGSLEPCPGVKRLPEGRPQCLTSSSAAAATWTRFAEQSWISTSRSGATSGSSTARSTP
ncbi:DUF4279 domain-containing protein [Streptomyces sp. NPDC052396]|uniref:DUF4279 domain-containing protein n=1 Tax=Streptomyces sp. NPDC052396 TaxID=3365689 RepID=UPI0037D6238E